MPERAMRPRHDAGAAAAARTVDQADGLRRLFGGPRRCLLAVIANPHVAATSVVLERLTAALSAAGRRTLLVDAADDSPPPGELTAIDLVSSIERLSADVGYLAARGLPRAWVDPRGSAAGLIDALVDAAPRADVLLLHASAADLARMLPGRAVRPLMLACDHPESVKHGYAGLKLLGQRCQLRTFDLLLAASPTSPRAAAIAASLGDVAERFLGGLLHGWAVIDPASHVQDPTQATLARLLAGQLAMEDAPALASGARAAQAASRDPN